MVGYILNLHSIREAFNVVSQKFVDIGGAEISKLHSDGAREYVALQKALGGVGDTNFFLSALYSRAERNCRKGQPNTGRCGKSSLYTKACQFAYDHLRRNVLYMCATGCHILLLVPLCFQS